MPRQTFETLLCAPIPVGHRVRLTFVAVRKTPLFGRTTSQELDHEPIVEDLTSGVVYCSEGPFPHAGVKEHRVPLPVGDPTQGDTVRVVEGTVVACRVVTVRGYSETDVQTRLVLEVDRDAAA